jgi:hypothetical protein
MKSVEFFEIYDQFYQRVRNFILASTRDEWAADDLTQETFIRVQKNLSTLKDSSKLAPWIFRIAYNLHPTEGIFRSAADEIHSPVFIWANHRTHPLLLSCPRRRRQPKATHF